MTNRRSQVLLLVALSLPLLIAAFGTAFDRTPFAANVVAQAANRMVGPRFPVLVDSNGNGRPDEGIDEASPPTGSPVTTFPTRWACPGGNDNLTFSNMDGTGKFTRVTHIGADGRSQAVTRSGPTSVSYTETAVFGTVRAAGALSAVDGNLNGVFEGFTLNGNIGVVSMSWAYFDITGDGLPDYVSIPWSQAALVGVRFGSSCGGSQPQVFAPLADSNGDGIPDSIVLDLNGDGVADPQFYSTPRLSPEATPAPTMPAIQLMILGSLLAALGYWAVTRRPLTSA